ncbi:37-kD nucleoid-associated bacterial protein [compost metagenome]
MGFFTDGETADLRITNMILHVVGGEEFTPESVRQVEHEEFFIARILDTDADAIYSFRETSATKAQLEKIATGAENFERGTQSLSATFSRWHVNSSRDGALFIFELSGGDEQTKLYSMIKYDYSEAIEQAPAEDGGLLRRIVHAFVADKKAIQKSSLVRVVNGVAETLVSARDRMKKAPEIVDYFANFLDVVRSMSDQELNTKVVSLLRETLTSCKADLPESVPKAFSVAKNALAQRREINEDAIIDAVLLAAGNPTDEKVITRLQNATRRKIRSARIENLVFPSDQAILGRPPMRRIRTTEGVTVLYPDDAGMTVTREPKAKGGELITIDTQAITEDKLVSDNPR